MCSSAKYLGFDTKCEDIFKSLQEYFEFHDIPLPNITAVACDVAPAVIGDISAFLMEIVPEVITVHCSI